MHRILWFGLGGATLNPWRKSLGLPEWHSIGDMLRFAEGLNALFLSAYSQQLVPKPPDWGPRHHVTGYWYLDPPAGWQPPDDLQRFLENGPPPVYVGFGSLDDGHAAQRTRAVNDALAATGLRGVLLTGWGGLDPVPPSDRVISVTDVPHAWLLPRVAAVVHHGGAGTTGSALRAGVPQIPTPFAGDQYAWRERAVHIGVAPSGPDIKRLNARTLATAIHAAVSNGEMRARAAALGESVRAENGVARAVSLIEAHGMRHPTVTATTPS
jgi:sterol 3beta-glucosyltransferase